MLEELETAPAPPPTSEEREARSAWRKERLRSLEEDSDQAQQIVERITELSRYSGTR